MGRVSATWRVYLTPPTLSLPLLSGLAGSSLEQVTQAIQNLRSIYIDPVPTLQSTALSTKFLPKHVIHDVSVPDSGYASAEEDEEEEIAEENACVPDGDQFDIDVLRSDPFERDFTIRWLTGFAARSDVWVSSGDTPEDEDTRTALVDGAATLLAFFTCEGDEEEALTRRFAFPGPHPVDVELNDAPLLSTDHTSVGLQSWASAIVLSERMCARPDAFSLECFEDKPLRLLELGAGTGLLSIVAAKLFAAQHHPHAPRPMVLATDFHPSVLANLQTNVDANFPAPSASCIQVQALDWETPRYEGALARTFDVVLAADVVYHPQHARWIRACVHQLLAPHGVFWLIIALRPTGRHEGMSDTVEAVFPRIGSACEGEGRVEGIRLVMLEMERLGRHEGLGRADESGYVLYKIGWAPC